MARRHRLSPGAREDLRGRPREHITDDQWRLLVHGAGKIVHGPDKLWRFAVNDHGRAMLEETEP